MHMDNFQLYFCVLSAHFNTTITQTTICEGRLKCIFEVHQGQDGAL